MQDSAILTDKDYENILQKIADNNNPERVAIILERFENKYVSTNTDFYSNLLAAYEQSEYYYYGDLMSCQILKSLCRNSFPDDLLKKEFLSSLITEKIDEYITAKREAQLKLSQLNIVYDQLLKLRSIRGIRKRYSENKIKKLFNNFKKVAYCGLFNASEITVTSNETLQLLISVYFSDIREDGVQPVTDSSIPSSGSTYIHFELGKLGNRLFNDIFTRNEILLQSLQSGKFGIDFRKFELSRWRAVLSKLSNWESGYDTVKKYIKYLENRCDAPEACKPQLPESPISFGIDEKNFGSIVQLCEDLKEINFLHGATLPSNFASLLTATDIKQVQVDIYLGCATTSACRVLELIGNTFKATNFNHTIIGESQSFFIPKAKKPTDKELKAPNDFALLKRSNMSASLKRFKEYVHDRDRPEQNDRIIIDAAFATLK